MNTSICFENLMTISNISVAPLSVISIFLKFDEFLDILESQTNDLPRAAPSWYLNRPSSRVKLSNSPVLRTGSVSLPPAEPHCRYHTHSTETKTERTLIRAGINIPIRLVSTRRVCALSLTRMHDIISSPCRAYSLSSSPSFYPLFSLFFFCPLPHMHLRLFRWPRG